jgi:hypothetical protein
MAINISELKDVTLVAIYLSPGVTAGASGFGIVGGKIVKIPPHEPAFVKIATGLQALAQTEGLAGAEEFQKAAEHIVVSGVHQLAGKR